MSKDFLKDVEHYRVNLNKLRSILLQARYLSHKTIANYLPTDRAYRAAQN